MALIKCKECGNEMSDKADKCPKCGAPKPKATSRVTMFVGGLIIIAVAMAVFKDKPSGATAASTPKPPPTAAEVESEKRFQTAVAGARWIKQNMHDPASFDLVAAGMIDGKTLCYTFRGKNSFNAVVLNHHVIGDKVNSSSEAAWSKYCAGRSGEDLTYLKHAL